MRSCIYAENPVLHSNTAKIQPLDNLSPLAKAGVPILHVCGSEDPWLEKNTVPAEKKYHELGGEMKVIVEPGRGHLPSVPLQPGDVVSFITASVQ